MDKYSFRYDFVWRDLGSPSDAYITGLILETDHPDHSDDHFYIPVEVHGQDIEWWWDKVATPLIRQFNKGTLSYEDMKKKLQGEED